MAFRCYKPIAWAAVCLIASSAAIEARAQSGRGQASGRNTGTLRQGYQSGGGNQRLPFSAAGRGGQTAGFGNRGMGMGAGVAGVGGAALGQGGVGDGPMSAGLAQAGSERFQDGGFVGRDAEDVRTSFQSQSGGRGPGGMLDTMIENLNDMRESRRRWREQNAAPPPVRVRLEPAFDLPAPTAGTVAPEVQTRLAGIMQSRGVASPQVQIAGGVAVIRGVVANEHERTLLAQIAALEPGVSQVENRVVIQESPAPPRR